MGQTRLLLSRTVARTLGALAASVAVVAALSGAGNAQERQWRHATALVGEPGYPPDFAHFDYVNPDAPKGGVVRLSGATPSYDTLNPILPKGVAASGIGLIYETLMVSSLDELEKSAEYGLLAEAMSYPEDYSSVTYRLRPEARWHDGEPVTAEDVVWSFDKLVELNPSQRFYYQHVTKAEVTGEREVTFTFDQAGNRELPHIVGQLLVLPQHWWEGTGPNGQPRNIGDSTLEPLLGSGPYRLKSINPGRSISFERVPDYWGANLNVNVGQNNFDEMRFEYYRDLTVQFEAFKADEFDFWSENQASRWATGYDFPAFNDGRVKKELVELEQVSGVMVGFVPNIRRPKLQDARVREALNLAFDFELLNDTVFYNQYERVDSYFYGIPLRWQGLPTGKELEILESLRDQVPPEVFTTEYKNPVNGSDENVRNNLRRAVQILGEAGYRLDGNRMVGPDGQQLSIELLLNGPTIERVALPYQAALARIGIDMQIRSLDSAQFAERVRTRDYDMIYSAWGQSMSPGNEQREYWGSDAADRDASRNYVGIKNPAIDAIIEKIIFAPAREDLEAATHALDRVLMWNHYVIPSYTILPDRIAYWDRFGHPEPYPKFTIGFPTVWWWDADKAARVGGGR